MPAKQPKRPAVPERRTAPTVLKGIPIEQCPSGWCYCESCQTCFTVQESLKNDNRDDSCPECGNTSLTYPL